MKIELLDITENAMKLIEKTNNSSFMPNHDISVNSDQIFCKKLIKMGYEVPFEHCKATFLISKISRACSHQLIRHRIASYSQRSQKYTQESDYPTYTPPSIANNGITWSIYKRAIDKSTEAYKKLISKGIPWEEARLILPNCQITELIMTANFREWRHIIKLRIKNKDQSEIQFLAFRILEILTEKYPDIFEDLKGD